VEAFLLYFHKGRPYLYIFYIVYATTAANPKENSFACYYDAELETYLGDVYSVKWMEDVDKVLISTRYT